MYMVKLEQFANEYSNDVIKVCRMMLQAYNLDSREDLRKHRSVQGQGEFHFKGKSNRYTFHGRGCRFSNDELEIDWDFGCEDSIWCGLDPWKLFYYLRDNKIDDSFSNGQQIKEEFDKLVVTGKMIKIYELYYFK